MTLEEFAEKFGPLPAQEKIRFIYTNIESLGKDEQINFLLSILKEQKSSPLVKATALKFLRQSSYQESGLYQNFAGDQFRALANAAKRAVKELGEKEKDNDYYAEAVLRKLDGLADKDRRLKILKAIAKLNAPWVLRVLVEALADPTERNRDFLIAELAGHEIRNPAILYDRLTLPPWYARSAVLKILAKRADSGALCAIEKTVADSNVDVRRTAAEALAEIGGEEALAVLVKLAKDKNSYVRQAARDALGKVTKVRFSG